MTSIDSPDFFKDAWNSRAVADRVKLAEAAGLEGRVGSRSWAGIIDVYRERITSTILLLSRHHPRQLKRISKELGVSSRYLKEQPLWIQEGRAPTCDEYTAWVRSQHGPNRLGKDTRACQHYQAAWPMTYYYGECAHCVLFHKPCSSFFANTGICETGFFVPEKITVTTWTDFQKQHRRAERRIGHRIAKG